MKKLITYFRPIAFTSDGKIAMEYVLISFIKDMRTINCKLNAGYEVTDIIRLLALAKEFNLSYTVIDDYRIRFTAPNGMSARLFQKAYFG